MPHEADGRRRWSYKLVMNWFDSNMGYFMIEVVCKNCGTRFEKESRHFRLAEKRGANHFCNRSCSAKYNNKKRKKAPQNYCECGAKIQKRSTRCSSCNYEHLKKSLSGDDSETLGEIYSRYPNDRHRASNVYALINGRARTRHRKADDCDNCNWGYNLVWHHVTPMSEFPMTATIAEINDRSNLMCLCRNCHAYFHEFNRLPDV